VGRICGLVLLLLVMMPGCASGDPVRPREYLDRRTGATLTIAARPWSFAREQPQLAVHARDYLTIYALRVNVGGRDAHYLAVFAWSTVDRRRRPRDADAADLTLVMDDRRVRLTGRGVAAREAGIADWPLRPPGRGARLHVFPLDEALLGHLSRAGEVRVKVEDSSDPDAGFDSWREGRAALAALLRE
jgi:hypothetical protein